MQFSSCLTLPGHVYDVKGIKTTEETVETKLHGVEVQAHIKALPQVP